MMPSKWNSSLGRFSFRCDEGVHGLECQIAEKDDVSSVIANVFETMSGSYMKGRVLMTPSERKEAKKLFDTLVGSIIAANEKWCVIDQKKKRAEPVKQTKKNIVACKQVESALRMRVPLTAESESRKNILVKSWATAGSDKKFTEKKMAEALEFFNIKILPTLKYKAYWIPVKPSVTVKV